MELKKCMNGLKKLMKKDDLILSILIPTYNREKFLLKNLKELSEYIIKNNCTKEVEIIISNNCSTDSTDKYVKEFIKQTDKSHFIKYFSRTRNFGLENNALFTFSKSKAKYVMFIGDDDYIEENYFINVLEKIKSDSSIYCIIPSFKQIDISGEIVPGERDTKIKSKIYNKGFLNCLKNSWRGHQLSGLTFKNNGMLESYYKNKVSNIHLFVYFTSYNCLKGKTWHFTNFPILVTQPGQENKDWTFHNDGLITEAFDNYVKLENLNYIQRVLLQLKFADEQGWCYRQFFRKSRKDFFKAIIFIICHKKTLLLTKILFPILVLKEVLKPVMRNIFKLKRK